ncbi:MAG: hypothetical protein SPL56_07365, partial [Lachnospiraceae bacterium]|nr:hypothetical protein [Lachnospiraceae bacterium]
MSLLIAAPLEKTPGLAILQNQVEFPGVLRYNLTMIGAAAGRKVLQRFTAYADFASARYKFESSADAVLSNSSNGANAPAAAFGKTACADFASAGYK